MSIYAEIAVDAPVRAGRTFSYSVPDGMDVTEGHFVLVPFGPKLLHGVIFEITDLLLAIPTIPHIIISYNF